RRSPGGVPWSAGSFLSPFRLASHDRIARYRNRSAGFDPVFPGAADDAGRGWQESKRVNGVSVSDKQGLILRVGLYILLAWMGVLVFSVMLSLGGIPVTSTLSTFARAPVATSVAV